MKSQLLTTAFIATMLSSTIPSAAAVWYVKAGATGDGKSWATASSDIDSIIGVATAGDEVWIAEGTYKPTQLIRSNRKASRAFTLKDGVSLYGGFAGTEAAKSERVTGAKPYEFTHETVLDADDDEADTWTRGFQNGTDYQYSWAVTSNVVPGTRNNGNHVLYGATTFTNQTVIDGLTLRGANASDYRVKAAGGALYAAGNVRLNACKVVENSAYFSVESMSSSDTNGGAVYLNGSAGAAITNCYFARNYSHSSYGNGLGGAVYAVNTAISNCDFVDCVALDNGGAIYNNGGTVSNCTFTGCYSSSGGAVYNQSGTVDSCYVYDCRGLLGGGIYNLGTVKNTTVANCTADTRQYGDDMGGHGGGIYNNGGSVNNVAVFNNVSFTGAGIFLKGGTLTNATVQNNAIRTAADTANVSVNNSATVTKSITTDVASDNFVNPTTFKGTATTAADSAFVRNTNWNVRLSSKLYGTGYSDANGEKPADMTITFADSVVGKNVEIAIGGTGSFKMDWGDGVQKDYSGANYFADTLKANQLKVYGDNILILLANNKAITALDVPNEPDMYRFSIEDNAIDSLDLTNVKGIRGLYAKNNGMKSIKLGVNTSSRPAVVDLSGNDIKGVIDLSSWSNLSKLDVTGNDLDSIGLPHSETLNDVSCDSNRIETLDFSNCSGLTSISANANKLKSINLTGCYKLDELYVGTNLLDSLNISDATELTSLTAYGNNIKSIDLSKNTKLEGVYLYNNQLSALDLTKNNSVRWLNVEYNNLSELRTDNMPNLSYLIANHNNLSSVDLSNNTRLSQIKLGSNNLSEFPAITASYLSYLKVDSNKIANIDLSKYSYLYWAELQGNQISKLDVTGNTYLQWLAADNNKLTTLDVSKNTGLQGLTIAGNKMDKAVLDSIINELPDVNSVVVNANNQHFAKIFDISNMVGTQTADKQPAVTKGWKVIAEGTATGISAIQSDAAKAKNSAVYNLNGQRVSNPKHGVYIINGKKVVVK